MKDTATRRRRLTDEDRNACMKLSACGLSNQEIADIMKVSYSSVAYIKQIYAACLDKDFDILRRLSANHTPTISWAMQLTGIEFPCEEIQPMEEPTVPEESVVQTGPEEKPAAADILTREFMLAAFDVFSDIRSLLTEIRDILK